ncbi:hypothetical protein Q1695_010198 [Nippostrongylus brasiliensis]|nr:hypothetical protein Q1695_010198 [Nippostrongylus brasiliensis]
MPSIRPCLGALSPCPYPTPYPPRYRCRIWLFPSSLDVISSWNELADGMTDKEEAHLEENHCRCANLLARLQRSIEELRVLRRLVELCIRTNELLLEAEGNFNEYRAAVARGATSNWTVERSIIAQDQSAANDDPDVGVPLSPKRVVHYESMIRSDAFGKCNICFEDEPFDPVGCIHCRQQVGCRKCVDRWYEESCRLRRKQCPLCRHKWEDQPEVLNIFELKLI